MKGYFYVSVEKKSMKERMVFYNVIRLCPRKTESCRDIVRLDLKTRYYIGKDATTTSVCCLSSSVPVCPFPFLPISLYIPVASIPTQS